MFFLFKLVGKVVSTIFTLLVLVVGYIGIQVYNTGHNAVPTKSDVIVVMGAAQNNGHPTPVLAARIDEAKALFKEGYAPRILSVGSNQKGDAWTEAQTTLRELRAHKIPSSVLGAVNLGKDTLSSTVAYTDAMKAKGYKSVIIVTDPYHCYRALSMAKDQGVLATCSPVKTGPASVQNSNWHYIVRETGAYIAYKTVGRFGIHLTDQKKAI
jgi:vancomycin permeability regulator SanA